jgi:tripartite-type tricarboxylate transporter receptor subunit TctC
MRSRNGRIAFPVHLLRGMPMIRRILTGATVLLFVVAAQAQTYPSKPVNVILPFSAGSGAEPAMRLFMQFIEPIWKQPIVLEFRPGAGSLVGVQAVAKAPPDGYTLLYTGAGLSQLKIFNKDMSFDPQTALVPISYFMEFQTFLLTNDKVPANTIDEFIAYAKANPGKVNYGAAGRSSTMLAMEAFKRETGAPLTEIQYGGQGAYVTAALRNDVQIVPAALGGGVKGNVESGALKALMVFGTKRSPVLPNVPSAADKKWNLPSFGWFGLYAPAGTPRPIIDKIAADVVRFAAQPDAQKKIMDTGAVLVGSTPEQFKQVLDNDVKVWVEIANSLGIKPE